MSTVKDELEFLRKQNNGFLRPQDVVAFAKNPDTTLHTQFEWNDGNAAEKYRLAQARAIIRVAVIVNPATAEKVRAYVSLSDSRDLGYRAIAEVLDDQMLTDRLLQDALKELTSFQKKYDKLKELTELGNVFNAIEQIVPNMVSDQAVA